MYNLVSNFVKILVTNLKIHSFVHAFAAHVHTA